MTRILLYVAIFLLGKRLRRHPRFARHANPAVRSYLDLHGAEAFDGDE